MNELIDDPHHCGWCKYWKLPVEPTGDTYNDKERGVCGCDPKQPEMWAEQTCEYWEPRDE